MNLLNLKKSISNILLLASLTIGANTVQASTLLDLDGQAAVTNQTYSASFIATANGEDISFGGFNGPSHTTITNLSVVNTTTSSGNLFASQNDYTQSPWNISYAPGNNSLITVNPTSVVFASTEYPDAIDQIIHTVIGQEYTISFTVSYVHFITSYNNGSSCGNINYCGDLFISANSVNLPVPEPSSFVLLSVGLLGLSLAGRKAVKV